MVVQAAVNEVPQSDAAVVRNLAALVERMRIGQERALEELYDATVGKLYALASAILRSAEDTEEIVCETYAYAWANASRFDASRANALGWLLMLCRSRALDRLRQRRATANAVEVAALREAGAAGPDQPFDILTLMQQRSRVHAALSQLTPERRHLISLAFLQGLSHQEIADVTRLPLGTVKSHVRRALTQLREALEGT
jgi:RNA polymerase sigma-70 factor (ECF subfamily)